MPQLEGQLVRLRAAEPEDIGFAETLERDTEASRMGGGWVQVPWSRHRVRKWLEELSEKPFENDIYRLVIETLTEPRVVGAINTHSIDRRVGVFGYGVVVLSGERRKGYASDAIRTLLRYFFDELGYQKCQTDVYGFNDASIEMHTKLGFTQEGRLRRTKYTDGAYHDEFLFGILREEFA